LSLKTNVILDIFGNPYALKLFANASKLKGVLISYEDTEVAQDLSAQLLFGGISAKGHLPVTINPTYKIGSGLTTSQIRLKYSIPAELNIDYKKLWEIDTLIYYAIQQKAFPGCQVLAIKDGVVFFQKQYGSHTYNMKDSVKWDDLYDLASVTKVAATTPSLMKLYEEGLFDVNGYMNTYLPQLDTTNKKYLRIIDVLTHQARLLPYVTFFQIALNPDGSWDTRYMSDKYSEKYCVRVTDDIYTTPDVQDYLYNRIYDSNLLR
jgi:CubicO group peptidase (beta-lactamase class C family)